MEQSKLNETLEHHQLWLNGNGGKRANLRGADLQYANLQYANLQYANLQYANLRNADLQGANLRGADLQYANLQYANLQYANLRNADLQYANLRNADLQDADIDFSCLPLWCGGLNFKIDEKQAKQLMYHVINIMQYSELDVNKLVKKQIYKWLSDSHIVTKYNLPQLKE